MKTKVLTAILVIGVTLQAAAIGHPHNLFAARKQLKAKRAAYSQTHENRSSRQEVINYVKGAALTTVAVCNWFYKNKAK